MRLALFLLAIAISALAVACGSSGADPTSTQRPVATSTPVGAILQPPAGPVDTPDFTLPSATGETVQLSDYRGEQPLVVVFYRGHF